MSFKDKIKKLEFDQEKKNVIMSHMFDTEDETLMEMLDEMMFYLMLKSGGEIEETLDAIDERRKSTPIWDVQFQPHPLQQPLSPNIQITTPTPYSSYYIPDSGATSIAPLTYETMLTTTLTGGTTK